MADMKVEIDRVLMAEIRMQNARAKMLAEQLIFIGSQVGTIEPDLDAVERIIQQAKAYLTHA